MKKNLFYILALAFIFTACAPSQKIIGTWVNKAALPKGPYKKVFVIVMNQNKNNNYLLEDEIVKLFNSRGVKCIRKNDLFPPTFTSEIDLTREQMSEAIKKAGCDAVFIFSIIDTKTETYYQPGSTYTYNPVTYGHYGSYYSYYNYYYPTVYSPGYYTVDKTYYIETNFFDMATEELIWSIQSQANNPTSIESSFKTYTQLILNKLREEKLIK